VSEHRGEQLRRPERTKAEGAGYYYLVV
jgi:hypothetical protein